MSDKVIRIGSQQGFADVWNNATPPTALNLVDFEIPRGLIVDMTKSYVAFNTEIQPETATAGATNNAFATSDAINAMLRINNLKADADSYEAPNSALIRNARISCDKGPIESMRRVDTLKCSLFNMEKNSEARQDDMNAFTAPKSMRGIGNQTSYFLDSVSRNTDALGPTTGNLLVGATSRQLARDVKVPLKSVFGIAEGADMWDTSKFGATRLHFETNWKHVKATQLGGSEATSLSFDATNTWGKAGAVIGVAASGDAGDSTSALVLSFPYTDYQQTLPFFVGQKILCSATSTHAPGSITNAPAVIASLQFDPATNFIHVTTETAWFTNTHTAIVNLSAVTIKSDNTYVPRITVNRAELVLFTRPDGETPDEYQYVTYTTEEDNGNGITSFARGYVMEGEAEQMLVCLAPQNEVLPSTVYESYRYAVNNEDQTGNRSIVPRSALQYDRLTRALSNQYTDWRNAQLKFANITPITPTQANMYDADNSTIVETLPLEQGQKYVDLQIECAGGVQDLRIYKQLVRTIRA